MKDGEIKTQEKQSLYSRQTWMRVIIVLGLTILYITIFQSIINNIGLIGAALITIPVATAAWFFGVNAGLAVSLFGIILNTVLLSIFEGKSLIQWIAIGWPGNLMVILVGYASGRLNQTIIEYKLAEIKIRSRERYLILLKMATNDVLNPKNPGDRHYDLITHFVNLLVADYGCFFRWDEKQGQIILTASTLPIEQQSSSILLKPDESAVIESILQTNHALTIDNVQDSLDIFNTTFFKNLEFPIHSALCLPVVVSEHKLGVIVLAYNALRHFTIEEIKHAEQGVQQVSLALWAVQQDFELKKRLHEVETLASISHALSETEKIGLQTVLQLIVTSARELIPGAEQAVIHLLDKEEQLLSAQAVSGYEDTTTNWKLIKIRPNEGIAGQVLVSGQTINIADVEKDSRFVTYAEPPKYRSLIVAPVQSGEQKLGTISVQSASVSAFTEAESRLLSALGTQAAIAIENAHLLESIQQALKESNALYRINQGLVASLEPQELLKDVVNLLQKNFGYYHVQIYVLEPETGDFVMREGSGEIGRQLKEQGYRLHAGEGIVGYTAETNAAFFTNDVDKCIFLRAKSTPAKHKI